MLVNDLFNTDLILFELLYLYLTFILISMLQAIIIRRFLLTVIKRRKRRELKAYKEYIMAVIERQVSAIMIQRNVRRWIKQKKGMKE